MTNADKIRGMTDEDLAEWLSSIVKHCRDEECLRDCPLFGCCSANMDGFLQQDAEGGEDNG